MMRRSFALLLPLFALAGCGGGTAGKAENSSATATNVSRPAGGLDRARYRLVAIPACANGMRRGNADMSPEQVDRGCACIVDWAVANGTDEELQLTIRNGEGAIHFWNRAGFECSVPTLLGSDMAPMPMNGAAPGGDEPPPPVVQDQPTRR